MVVMTELQATVSCGLGTDKPISFHSSIELLQVNFRPYRYLQLHIRLLPKPQMRGKIKVGSTNQQP